MANFSVAALTGSAGGTNVPLADMSTNAVEQVVVVRDASPSNATPYRTVPVSSIAPGGVASVGGTAPIVSTGGANPVVSINPATTSTAGSLSAADKTKLDSITAVGKIFSATVPGGGSVPANSGTTLTVTVTGVLATDAVFANQTSATFPVGLSITNAFASGANQITLEMQNCTTTSKSIPTNFPIRVGVLR